MSRPHIPCWLVQMTAATEFQSQTPIWPHVWGPQSRIWVSVPLHFKPLNHRIWLSSPVAESNKTGLDFIIKDLPTVLIILFANQKLKKLLCCSYKYNWYLCRLIGKLQVYFLLLTFLIHLSEICINLHEVFGIKLKLN